MTGMTIKLEFYFVTRNGRIAPFVLVPSLALKFLNHQCNLKVK